MSFTDDPEQDALAQTCSPKEQAFAREYIIDFNATESVYRAGCFNVSTRESAGECGSRLLKRPQVQALVEVLKAQRLQRTNMTADSVLHEMSLLSHSSVDHYLVDDEGNVKLAPGAPEGAMGAIKSIDRKKIVKLGKGDDGEGSITYEVKLTLWDKPAPLKLMGRHVGLFPDKLEVTGKDGKPLETITRIERVIIDAAEQKAS
jgi:phage terminase small subunit